MEEESEYYDTQYDALRKAALDTIRALEEQKYKLTDGDQIIIEKTGLGWKIHSNTVLDE